MTSTSLESDVKEHSVSRTSRYRNWKDINLLEYFKEHKEYQKLTRYGLFLKDQAFYRVLLRYGQLEEAIPESCQGIGAGRKPIDEEREKIIEAHKTFFGNASRVSERTNWSIRTVLNIWHEEGLETKNPGNYLSNEEEDKIVKSYETCKSNALKASKGTGHPIKTVIKIWRKNNLLIRSKGRPSHAT